jgi:hypothetical protein
MPNKLGTNFATEQFKPETLPRADAVGLSRTGQELEAQTLQAAGAALTGTAGVVFKWFEREGNSQYDTARGLAQDRIGEFQRTNFDNSNEHDAAFKALKADLKGFAPKNKSGATKYNSWSDLNNASLEKIDATKKIKMIAVKNGQAYFNNIVNLAKIADKETFTKEAASLTAGAVDDKLRTPNQGASDLEKATDDWTRADLWRQAMAAGPPRTDGEVDWQATNDWLDTAENLEGIDPKIFKGLAETANARNNAQKAGDKEKVEEQKEVERDKIYDLINSNSPDAVSAIEASSLDQAEQQRLRNSIGTKTPMNWAEWNKVFDMIDQVALGNIEKQTAIDAIAAGVGVHFDGTAGKALRTKLAEKSTDNSPTKREFHKRGITAIEEIFDARIKGIEDISVQQEGRMIREKGEMKNEFDKWALEKPRTDEETEKKIQSLTRMPADKVVLGFFTGLFTPKIFGAQKTTLQSKRFEAFKKKSIFETLSDSDIEKAKTAFRLNKTLDEVLEAFGE